MKYSCSCPDHNAVCQLLNTSWACVLYCRLYPRCSDFSASSHTLLSAHVTFPIAWFAWLTSDWSLRFSSGIISRNDFLSPLQVWSDTLIFVPIVGHASLHHHSDRRTCIQAYPPWPDCALQEGKTEVLWLLLVAVSQADNLLIRDT